MGMDMPIIAIGGFDYNNGQGRSYVVFGGPKINGLSVFNLSNLNGTNGFKIDGEMVNDWSGYSINPEGDLNGDGYDDSQRSALS